MILTCNSCDKKFVVPDSAITASGRMVQCGSCGNKWKQFPVKGASENKSISSSEKNIAKSQKIQQKKQKPKKSKNTAVKKIRDISLYSPEYLAKKHGIKLKDDVKEVSSNEQVSFGFYNSLLLFIILIIILSRGLYFFQDFIVEKFPLTKFYIDYFFESIRNIFEIWKNLISNY